jgi:transcription elongation factor Elf1
MKSHWVVQKAENTTCSTCTHTVDLLCRVDGVMKQAFYICWECKAVAQVGVGPVPREP